MIGIIGAMEEEVSQLIEAMEEKEKVTCAGMDFYCGKLSYGFNFEKYYFVSLMTKFLHE